MKSKLTQLAAALAAATLATAAMAATEDGTLTVNASVVGACAVGDATLNFTVAPAVNADGTGPQTSADVDSFTTVNVVCTNGQSGTLSADPGQNNSSGRRMSNGVADTPTFLAYELYTDSGRLNVFDTTNTMSVTGSGTAESKTIYGRIPAAAAAAAPKGSYTDSVKLTVTYTP